MPVDGNYLHEFRFASTFCLLNSHTEFTFPLYAVLMGSRPDEEGVQGLRQSV
jgi:hypothetical protein